MNNVTYGDLSIPNVVEISVSFDNPLGYPESDDRTFIVIQCSPDTRNKAHLAVVSMLKSYIGRGGDLLSYELENGITTIPYTMITNIDMIQNFSDLNLTINFYSSSKPETIWNMEDATPGKIKEEKPKPKKIKITPLGSRIIEFD